MQKNLLGINVPAKVITVNVYHDERQIPKKWLYHSFLFIPTHKEEAVLNSLNGARFESGWRKELHFKELQETKRENL